MDDKKLDDKKMDDKKSLVEQIEDKIKDAAKAVEDFADKVAAPEEPLVLLPEEDASQPPKPSTTPPDKGVKKE